MLKRLDNHLSRYHKGITRGMNDSLQPQKESHQSRVKCLLPGCFKEVKHFPRHLKNMHSMSVSEYEAQVKTVEQKWKQKRANIIETTKKGNLNVLTKFKEGVFEDDFKRSETNVRLFSDVRQLKEGSEEHLGHVNPENKVDEQQVTETACANQQEATCSNLNLDSEINGYCEDELRYLVHNTTPDGLRFFLVAMRNGKSLKEFHQSRLCKVMLGELPISTLEDIYLYRKYLTSFYRLARYYPYPEKSMIHHCLACNAREQGSCECPTLPKAFYIFCRQQCSSDWNCQKCINFDRVRSHFCFDFFECRRCDEEYKSRYKPYP